MNQEATTLLRQYLERGGGSPVERTRVRLALHRLETRRDCIGWLGKTGTGKSYCLNTLLWIFEREQEQYNRPPRPVLSTLPSLELSALVDADLSASPEWVIVPNAGGGDALFYAAELEKDRISLDQLRNPRDRFSWSSADGFPPFLLPIAGRYSWSSTTRYVTEIKGGSTYGLKVTYMTRDEVMGQLMTHNFEIGEWATRSKPSMERKFSAEAMAEAHAHKIMWMKHLNKPTRRLKKALKKAKLEEEEELKVLDERRQSYVESGGNWDDYIPMGAFVSDKAYFRELNQTLELVDKVTRIAGKTIVFQGNGTNKTEDRMFIRRALNGVMLGGIGREMGHALGTTLHSAGSQKDPEPDVFMISKIEVTVPNELLGPGTVWMDLPGTNDMDAVKTQQLYHGLAETNSLITLFELTSDRTLNNVLNAHVTNQLDRWNKLSFFHYLRDEMMENEPENVTRLQSMAKLIKTKFYEETIQEFRNPARVKKANELLALSGNLIRATSYLKCLLQEISESETHQHGYRMLIKVLLQAEASSLKTMEELIHPPVTVVESEVVVVDSTMTGEFTGEGVFKWDGGVKAREALKKQVEEWTADEKMTLPEIVCMVLSEHWIEYVLTDSVSVDLTSWLGHVRTVQLECKKEWMQHDAALINLVLAELVPDEKQVSALVHREILRVLKDAWIEQLAYHTKHLSSLKKEAELARFLELLSQLDLSKVAPKIQQTLLDGLKKQKQQLVDHVLPFLGEDGGGQSPNNPTELKFVRDERWMERWARTKFVAENPDDSLVERMSKAMFSLPEEREKRFGQADVELTDPRCLAWARAECEGKIVLMEDGVKYEQIYH